jgi:hypothetical protein
VSSVRKEILKKKKVDGLLVFGPLELVLKKKKEKVKGS